MLITAYYILLAGFLAVIMAAFWALKWELFSNKDDSLPDLVPRKLE
jgi:hypothetical protein